MVEFNLQEVLDECQKSAKIGYELASSQYKRLRDTIANAESKIEDIRCQSFYSAMVFHGKAQCGLLITTQDDGMSMKTKTEITCSI